MLAATPIIANGADVIISKNLVRSRPVEVIAPDYHSSLA